MENNNVLNMVHTIRRSKWLINVQIKYEVHIVIRYQKPRKTVQFYSCHDLTMPRTH